MGSLWHTRSMAASTETTPVYSQTTILPADSVDLAPSEALITRTKWSVFSSPRGVSLVSSSFLRGSHYRSGKTWARWKADRKYTVFMSANGKIMFSHWDSKLRYCVPAGPVMVSRILAAIEPSDSTDPMSMYAKACAAFRAEVKRQYGIDYWQDAFPMTKAYELSSYEQMPKGLRGAFRVQDVQSFTKELFGKTRYRKDLVKAVAQADVSGVALALQFRGLVPVDWIIRLLLLYPRTARRYSNLDYSGLRPLLKRLDPRSLRYLTQHRAEPYMLTELSRWAIRIGRRRDLALLVRSWDELHDQIGGTGRPEYVWRNEQIPQTKFAKKLDGLSTESGLRIVTPSETATLNNWSEVMGNCIRGYSGSAVAGRLTLVGVYQGDKLVANLEITNSGRLNQLLGKHNQKLPDDQKAEIIELLAKNDVTVNEYWGK